MTKLRIIQISDTHLTPEGSVAANNQRIDPYLKLEKILADVYHMPEKPDFIVLSGDLIHEGQAQDYSRLKEFIDHASEQLGIKVYPILGNHDRTRAFFKGYLNSESKDQYYYDVSTDEYNIYFLDTTFNNIEQGLVGEKQLSWLESKLIAEPNKKSIIFMHHPLDGAPVRHMRYSILQDGEELLNIIKNYNVQGVFSGHIHFATSYIRDGILMATADSSAYHINCDDHHNHLVSDTINYSIVSVDDDGVGVETRNLLSDERIINQIPVGDTEFIDKKIFE